MWLELMTVLISSIVAFLIAKWQIKKDFQTRKQEEDNMRYALLSIHKLKLFELPIFLENIISLANIHGSLSEEEIYNDYKDRIVKMQLEKSEYIDEILRNENIVYLSYEDIDCLLTVKSTINYSWSYIIQERIAHEDNYNSELIDVADSIRAKINNLPGPKNNDIYLEYLKYEFGWI